MMGEHSIINSKNSRKFYRARFDGPLDILIALNLVLYKDKYGRWHTDKKARWEAYQKKLINASKHLYENSG